MNMLINEFLKNVPEGKKLIDMAVEEKRAADKAEIEALKAENERLSATIDELVLTVAASGGGF